MKQNGDVSIFIGQPQEVTSQGNAHV